MSGKKRYPSHSKAARALLSRIRQDTVELEFGRMDALEEVRAWDLNPVLRDRLMHKIARQTTKAGLVQAVEEFLLSPQKVS